MAWQGSSPNRTRGRAWRRLRAQVLLEEPYCRWCIERRTVGTPRPSTICDHIKPLAEGGTDERSNLAGMCTTCHDEKTAAEAARAMGREPPRARKVVGVDADGWPVGT